MHPLNALLNEIPTFLQTFLWKGKKNPGYRRVYMPRFGVFHCEQGEECKKIHLISNVYVPRNPYSVISKLPPD